MGSSMMYSAMQRPEPSKMVENLFSNIDTSGKGYIEKADLESAMSQLTNANNLMSSDEMFDQMDTNGDGKVTQEEMASSLENMAEEMGVRIQGKQPPPPSGMGEAPSFSLEELNKMAADTSSPMSDMFSQLAENFDEADTNSDGVISREEAMNFQGANENEEASAVSSDINRDMQLMRTITELMKTYGMGDDSLDSSSFTAIA